MQVVSVNFSAEATENRKGLSRGEAFGYEIGERIQLIQGVLDGGFSRPTGG